ncbi:hypothetical protein M569_13488, partial [Genlisea aurea]
RGKNGSGKTYAYLIYMLNYCYSPSFFVRNGRYKSIIIILPTTELCQQVCHVFKSWLKFKDMKKANVNLFQCNDMNHHTLKVDFKKCFNIIASTPDCLISCMENGFIRKKVLKKSVFRLIIDDVDQLLLDGNENQLNKIAALVPERCHSIIISNDPSCDLTKLKNFVRTPPYVMTLDESDSIKVEVIPCNVFQHYIYCDEKDKAYVFFQLWIAEFFFEDAVIFTNSIEKSSWLKLFLEQFGLKSEVISFASLSTSNQHI